MTEWINLPKINWVDILSAGKIRGSQGLREGPRFRESILRFDIDGQCRSGNGYQIFLLKAVI